MAKVGRLKLVHLSVAAQDVPELVTMSEAPTFWEQGAREIYDPDEHVRREMERLAPLPPNEATDKLYNHPDCVGGIIWNFLTDLPQFHPDYRAPCMDGLLRLARRRAPSVTLLEQCDRIIQRFTKLFRGYPTLGMVSLAAMERVGYLYEDYHDYERLYTGLRKVIKPLQVRNEIPETRLDINATEVITTTLIHIIKYLQTCGVEDLPVELSARDPELIVLAMQLLVQDERVHSPDNTLSDEAGANTLTLGHIWSMLTILTDHGFNVAEVRTLVHYSTMKVVLYLVVQYTTGALDQAQIRTLIRNVREVKTDVPTEVVNSLKQWDAAGRPNFRLFLYQGGTAVQWHNHLKHKEALERASRERRELQARAPQPAPRAPTESQATTGNKRRHRNFEPPKEKPQTDWDRLRNLVREIVLKHLPDHDADLVSAILLTLMRSGDRLMEPTRWPQIKTNKLRSRVRRRVENASNREINEALRELEAIRLVRQSGGKYQIATGPRSTRGALDTRTALTKLRSNT